MGTKNEQQSSYGSIDKSYVLIFLALFIISSLFIPANGLIIGSSLASETTCIFDNVCDDTCPILSPVINARAFIFFATSFAIIIMYLLKKTTQNFSGTCSIIFS